MPKEKKAKTEPTLPPRDFSNAMNRIYKDWDFRGWEKSNEWKLFNAGVESGAQELAVAAAAIVHESGQESRGNGRHSREW